MIPFTSYNFNQFIAGNKHYKSTTNTLYNLLFLSSFVTRTIYFIFRAKKPNKRYNKVEKGKVHDSLYIYLSYIKTKEKSQMEQQKSK